VFGWSRERASLAGRGPGGWNPIVIPEHALLIMEERLREQQGVRMPEGITLDELALRVLIAAAMGQATEEE
jgi:hypothetical protein